MRDKHVQEALERWEAWWQRSNTGPLFTVIYPRQTADFSPWVKPWMSPVYTGKWSMYLHEFAFGHAVELAWRNDDMRFVDEALELLAHYRDFTGWAGGAFPFMFANVGAMMMPALLTEQTRFLGDTIWTGADPHWEWDQIEALEGRQPTKYAQVVEESLRRLAARLGGSYVIAPPELGSTLDTLSALRGNQNLLVDLLMTPDRVQAACSLIEHLWWDQRRRFADIVDPANDGLYVQVFRYLSAKPTLAAACDFSAMISPDLFESYYLPYLQRQLGEYGERTMYHLDGPGELVHVDLLCAQPALHSVQWVHGAGKPNNLDESWYGLYRTLLDAGKRVYFCSIPHDPAALKRFFEKFPSSEFMIPFTARDEQSAVELMRWADGRW
ncbi:MAG: hypothetical protein GF331_25520 [Chitinivibrionales bacterium]|nr:hypothetical protein [Chitinivibrionales bacterium]